MFKKILAHRAFGIAPSSAAPRKRIPWQRRLSMRAPAPPVPASAATKACIGEFRREPALLSALAMPVKRNVSIYFLLRRMSPVCVEKSPCAGFPPIFHLFGTWSRSVNGRTSQCQLSVTSRATFYVAEAISRTRPLFLLLDEMFFRVILGLPCIVVPCSENTSRRMALRPRLSSCCPTV